MERTDRSSQRVRVLGDLTNRTGLHASDLAEEMCEGMRGFTPEGSEAEFREFRALLLRDGDPIGTIPRPASLHGAAKQAMAAMTGRRPLVLLDKLAERLAFERSGTRLYDTLLMKHATDGGFEGGPTRDDLMWIRDQELEHFRELARFIEELGGDPTAVTPSADIAAVASMGVVQVVCDPRTSLGESLEAILVAELVDHECWRTLRSLARDTGPEPLALFAERAEDEEDNHLVRVRGWIRARLEVEGSANA